LVRRSRSAEYGSWATSLGSVLQARLYRKYAVSHGDSFSALHAGWNTRLSPPRHFCTRSSFFKKGERFTMSKTYQDTPNTNLYAQSWAWAVSASVEALAHADELSLMRIQALQVLQLYYFSQSEMNCSIIRASQAYPISQLLGYDILYDESVSRGIQFDLEMKRRTFWTSWCSFILTSEQPEPLCVFDSLFDLPLPWKFGKGDSIQEVELAQGEKTDSDWRSRTEPSMNRGTIISLMEDLVKAVRMW
jgi:hypothetical protein